MVIETSHPARHARPSRESIKWRTMVEPISEISSVDSSYFDAEFAARHVVLVAAVIAAAGQSSPSQPSNVANCPSISSATRPGSGTSSASVAMPTETLPS